MLGGQVPVFLVLELGSALGPTPCSLGRRAPGAARFRTPTDPKDLAPPRLQVGAGAQRLAGRWAQTRLHASSPPESVVETTGRDKINTFPESESALQLGKCFSLSQAGETERRVSKPKHAVHSPPRGRQWPARVPTGTERRAMEPLSSVSVLWLIVTRVALGCGPCRDGAAAATSTSGAMKGHSWQLDGHRFALSFLQVLLPQLDAGGGGRPLRP